MRSFANAQDDDLCEHILIKKYIRKIQKLIELHNKIIREIYSLTKILN